MPLLLEHLEAPTDDARMLIDELDAELSGPYSAEQRHGLSIARVFQPGVMFFIARLDGDPVGCGGVAFEEDGFAEIKRMYVRPQARGRDIARTLLARLEQEARAHGATRLTLETGDAQHAALRFYQRAGFTRCAAFGAYATMPAAATERSVFFEKTLL
ncbi:MAG: ysnE [Phycisphaerales bacterium]|nr:ysnE [Phycisphaerales bacterium]